MSILSKLRTAFNLAFFIISFGIWGYHTASILTPDVVSTDLWKGFALLYGNFDFKRACIALIAINGIAATVDLVRSFKRLKRSRT